MNRVALELPATLTAPAPALRLAYLDGWRGLAVLALLAGHFFDLPVVNLGRLGVELFFVLSGRLMAEILFVHRQPLPEFFRRRVARLWPALAFYVIVAWIILPPEGWLHAAGLEAVSALTFSSNYFVPGGRSSVLGHTWSLCVEEHAYVALALLVLLARKTGRTATAALLILACVGMLNGALRSEWLDHTYRSVYVRTDVRVASIFLSCAVYLLLRSRATRSTPARALQATPARTTLVPLAFTFAGLLLNAHVFPDCVKYTAGSTCLAIAVCTIDRLPPALLRALGHPALTMMGLWSYSIYLWQQPFYKVGGYASDAMEDPLAETAVRAVLLVAALICALISFYTVEQPLRRRLNRWWSFPHPRPALPA